MEAKIEPMKYIDNKIDEYGYTMIFTELMVENTELCIAYTIGMSQQNLPEFMVTGLPQEKSAQFLYGLVSKALEGVIDLDKVNASPTETLLLQDINSIPLRLVDVTDYFFAQKENGQVPLKVNDFHPYLISRYYEEKGTATPIKLTILCYPDKNGLFAWDPGSDIKGLDLFEVTQRARIH